MLEISLKEVLQDGRLRRGAQRHDVVDVVRHEDLEQVENAVVVVLEQVHLVGDEESASGRLQGDQGRCLQHRLALQGAEAQEITVQMHPAHRP